MKCYLSISTLLCAVLTASPAMSQDIKPPKDMVPGNPEDQKFSDALDLAIDNEDHLHHFKMEYRDYQPVTNIISVRVGKKPDDDHTTWYEMIYRPRTRIPSYSCAIHFFINGDPKHADWSSIQIYHFNCHPRGFVPK